MNKNVLLRKFQHSRKLHHLLTLMVAIYNPRWAPSTTMFLIIITSYLILNITRKLQAMGINLENNSAKRKRVALHTVNPNILRKMLMDLLQNLTMNLCWTIIKQKLPLEIPSQFKLNWVKVFWLLKVQTRKLWALIIQFKPRIRKWNKIRLLQHPL